METLATNSLNETHVDKISKLPKEKVINTQYSKEEFDSLETLEAVEQFITADVEKNSVPQLNRAQRRALAKKAGKKGRNQIGTISETARKLNYINLIQQLRELNKKQEEVKDNEN